MVSYVREGDYDISVCPTAQFHPSVNRTIYLTFRTFSGSGTYVHNYNTDSSCNFIPFSARDGYRFDFIPSRNSRKLIHDGTSPSKDICLSIAIFEDSVIEGDQRFSVLLESSSRVILGSNKSRIIFIVDNGQ